MSNEAQLSPAMPCSTWKNASYTEYFEFIEYIEYTYPSEMPLRQLEVAKDE